MSEDEDSLIFPYQAGLTGDCIIDTRDVELYINYTIYGQSVFPEFPPATCCYVNHCCVGIRGNVDNDSTESITVADATFLVRYLFHGGPDPVCYWEANVDGSAGVTVSDATFLVNYLFHGGDVPPDCPVDLY